MSLFRPEPAPPPRPRVGPPPKREKPPVRAAPEFDPNPPLKRVAKGEVVYLRARVSAPTTDYHDKPAVWLESIDEQGRPVRPGDVLMVPECELITHTQIVGAVRRAMERGAA